MATLNNLSTACSVCASTFEDPRLVPCGHSFCQKCIEQVIQGMNALNANPIRFRCALCTKETNVPANGFPANYQLRDLVQDVQSMAEEEQQSEDVASEIQIFLKTLTGKTISLVVSPLQTVFSLKRKIDDREGIKPEAQRLVFGGTQLEDDKTLAHYNIEKGVTIHLLIRLLGGHCLGSGHMTRNGRISDDLSADLPIFGNDISAYGRGDSE